MTLKELNTAPENQVAPLLQKCCGAEPWVSGMITKRPFDSIDHLLLQAKNLWDGLSQEHWMEAFEHHPQIGDLDSIKKKFSNTSSLAAEEQRATSHASDYVLQQLADYNRQYFEKFGFIFIICATGKSAEEMLGSIKKRIGNQLEQEIQIASGEQIKITCLRLKKMIK